MSGVPGLRERKKAATRAALRTAAVRLFRRYGPDAVTVDDICAEADVSPRTFFNYFTAKDEAVFGWDCEQAKAVADQIAHRPVAEDPLAALEAVLGGLIDEGCAGLWHEQMLLLREHPTMAARMHAASSAAEVALVDGLARRTGLPAADPYLTTLAAVALTTWRTSIVNWLDGPRDIEPQASFGAAVSLIRAGFAPPSSVS